MGIDFPNPLGLAAGFDKDAVALRPLAALGFGFIEAGSVTLRAQPGNPRPRMFRLAADRAVINRMGMNGGGLEPFAQRLAALAPRPVPVGANLGLNKDGADPDKDYAVLAARLAKLCDYLVINVSSPNTPGLRDLQAEERLAGILRSVMPVRGTTPVLVKVAPDLSEDGLAAIVEAAVAHSVAGLIVGNTTTSRPPTLRDPQAGQQGGLSGAPLAPLAEQMLRRTHRLAAGRLVLVGCGGIASGEDAYLRIRAGAALIQLYTAFAYAGPALVVRLLQDLAARLRADGFASVADAVGVDA
jgi:dihydroorotate dehydrogenase